MIELFGRDSQDPTSNLFDITSAKQFTAIGLGEDDYIEFEIVQTKDTSQVPTGRAYSVCGSDGKPKGALVVVGSEKLTCCDGSFVRITKKHPVVVRSVPHGLLMRAVYTGSNLGDFTLTAIEFDTKSIGLGGETGCCNCSEVEIETTVVDKNSITVRITKGGPAQVTVSNGEQSFTQYGSGPFTFSGLKPNTVYSVVAENDCGEKATAEVKTTACPPLTISTSSTLDSITVTITSGADARVSLSGYDISENYELYGAGPFVFKDLKPNHTYYVLAVSECSGDSVSNDITTSTCPTIEFTAVADNPNQITVTVSSGAPCTVKLNGKEQSGSGPFVFSGLAPDTSYVVAVTSACSGAIKTNTVSTPGCPAVSFTTTSTSDSITVTLTGAKPATVSANGVLFTGDGPFTFDELKANTSYVISASTACGAITASTTKTQPCPAVTFTVSSSSTSSLTVTLTGEKPAIVSIGADVQVGDGPFTFNGLQAGKQYTILAETECGATAYGTGTVTACTPLEITATADSETSVVVEVTAGGPATVSIADQEAIVTTSHTFTGLEANKVYTVKAVSECGVKTSTSVTTPAFPTPAPLPCPSKHLKSYGFNGYAFATGDLVDPAATVTYNGFKIYPTAGLGHTVKVTNDAGATLGFAINQSTCAPPCNCEPEPIIPEPITEWFFDFDDLGGGGACVGIEADGPTTVYQGRTGTIVSGGGSVPWPPVGNKYLQLNIEATRPPELVGVACAVELEFVAHCAAESPNDSARFGFVHGLTTDLNIQPPANMGWDGSVIDDAWVYTNFSNGADNMFLDFPASQSWTADNDSAATSSRAKKLIVLAAGQTAPTHYLQWWVVFTGSHSPYVAFHAASKIRGRWVRGVAV